ncbi:phosphatase PAP2 family protein [Streptomyces yatensis]|uniref:Phosphatase PAP2 family protein n=1 Tax=Streptomyces yatensis TaxID=155177 RepID=A0ABN2IVC2_9ACTN|nr:phosphatase PAP2 family protein [Streptomyces yatensis]
MKRKEVAGLAGGAGLASWVAFGALSMVVICHDGAPLLMDHGLLAWSMGHRPEVAVALARGLTATGTGVTPYVLVAVAGVVVGRTLPRRLLAAASGLACLGAGQALRYGVMTSIARARPPHTDWDTHASGWSFPSGHATTAALTAGLVILAIWVRAPRGRVPVCLVVGCWGALVGLTRVYLGVHWFTDVIGGWLFAIGWLGVCLCAAIRWPPTRFVTEAAPRDEGGTEGDGPQNPGRRG